MSKIQNKLQNIGNEQIKIFFSNLDQSNTKVWQTAEWKQKRNKLIGDTCEWCGDDNDDTVFQLHHDEFTKPNYNALWVDASDWCFVNSSAFDHSLVENRTECPSCKLSDFYARKTKTPEYRCNKCKHKFSQPKTFNAIELALSKNQRVQYYITDEYHTSKLKWLKQPKHKQQSREKFAELVEEKWNEYKSLVDTITICRSCHFQHHKRGRQFCEKCESEWHSSKYDMCWDCIVDENNLKKCNECDEKWFNPTKYNKCKNCR